MKTIRNTHKKLLALLFVLATLLSVLALPVSAKEAGGFRYYLEESYEDDADYYAVITGHPGAVNGTLTIPEKLNGYEVYIIASAAFMDRKDITKVVLPDAEIIVHDRAFEGCSNLKTLTVGECYIWEGAFKGCKSLRQVNIQAVRYHWFDPECAWNKEGNDPLFDANWTWTRYRNTEYAEDIEINTCTGRRVTLEADYTLKEGERCHWYSESGWAFEATENWEECADTKLHGKAVYPDVHTVVCEVTNKKGDVIWAQSFIINARASLGYMARNAIESSYLYGVTDYTISHIRWKVYDCLEAIGIDPYAD